MNRPCADHQIHLCLTTCGRDALRSVPGRSADQIKAPNCGRDGRLRHAATHGPFSWADGAAGASPSPAAVPGAARSGHSTKVAGEERRGRAPGPVKIRLPPPRLLPPPPPRANEGLPGRRPPASAGASPLFPDSAIANSGTRWLPSYFFLLSSFLSFNFYCNTKATIKKAKSNRQS